MLTYLKSKKEIVEKLTQFIKAFLASAALTIYSNTEINNIMTIILLIIFYIIFKSQNNNVSKKQQYLQLTLAVIFSIILSLGKYIDVYKYDYSVCGIVEAINLKNIIVFIGFVFILYYLIETIITKYNNTKFDEKIQKLPTKKLFYTSFVVMLLCWTPYFLNYFPGYVTSDTVGEYGMAAGVESLIDHHPVVHSMFIGMFYNAGNFIFKSGTMGVACATIAQMIIMALIFSYFICFMHKHKINSKIVTITLLFFAILPINAFFSINTWKDTLFSGTFLLLNIVIFNMYEKGKNTNIKDYAALIVTSLATLFFRNNGIYVYMLWSPFLIILFKKRRKIISLILFSIIISYFIIKGPVFNYLNIYNTSSAESLSIPMQQIGYITAKNIKLTKNEEKAINDILKIETLKKVYDPTISDPIKFNPDFNIGPYAKNKMKYLKLWAGLVSKHPLSALEAYLNITLGFWYPNLFYSVVPNEIISSNGLGIKEKNICPPIIKQYVSNVEPYSRKVPIVNAQWNGALCFWILLICMVISYLNNGKKSLIFYVSILGIWITMMIATPVYASFRYIYGMFISIPYMIVLPKLYKNISKKVNNWYIINKNLLYFSASSNILVINIP